VKDTQVEGDEISKDKRERFQGAANGKALKTEP
jgi:hypothetical protein